VIRRRAAAALAFVAIAACGGRQPGTRAAGPPVALVLPAVDGGEIDVAAYRGHVVVVHVFTTWSLAATGDVPQLRDADAREDTIVIGIATDPEGSTVVVPWRKALGVQYLIALADAPFRAGDSALGRVAEVPITFVLDRRGVVARRIDRQLVDGELTTAIAEVISSAR